MLNIYYYIIFTIFAVIAYMMIVDENVVRYIEIMFQLFVINLKRLYYMVVFHPDNKLTTWSMNYKFNRMTRKLQKEMEQNDSSRPID